MRSLSRPRKNLSNLPAQERQPTRPEILFLTKHGGYSLMNINAHFAPANGYTVVPRASLLPQTFRAPPRTKSWFRRNEDASRGADSVRQWICEKEEA